MRTLRNALLALLLAAVLHGPGRAHAEEMVTAAVKVGGAFPSLFSGLDTTFQTEVEAGMLLLESRLDVSLTLGYARPPATHSADDPRMAEGSFEWSMQQDILVLGVLGRYRFLPSGSFFNAYGALGPRLYMLRTTANGTSGGAELGENRQYDTQAGLAVAVGTELALGPGLALAELHLGAGSLRGLVTGDVTASAPGLLVGYRMSF
ncbi:MAG: outer membrane beta-barrel protein [Myxococcota bacterium]